MKNILLCWELGAGAGHYLNLLPLAQEFKRRGCRVMIAGCNLFEIAPLLSDDFEYFATPCISMVDRYQVQQSIEVGSLEDIFYSFGFSNIDAIKMAFNCWKQCLDSFNPDLIVSEYNHFLNAYALGQYPIVNIGTGHTLAPADQDRFSCYSDKQVDNSLIHAQAVANINVNRARFKLPSICSITELYRSKLRVITSSHFLDPFSDTRPSTDITHPMGIKTALLSVEPKRNSDRVYCYLVGNKIYNIMWPKFIKLFEALGDRAILYIKELNAADRKTIEAYGCELLTELPALEVIAGQTDVIIHHGGLGTAQDSIAAGLCQYMIPLHGEMESNVEKIESLGVGMALDIQQHPRKIIREINQKNRREGWLDNIEAIRGEFQQCPQSVDALVDKIFALYLVAEVECV